MEPLSVFGVFVGVLVATAPAVHAQETFIEYSVTGSATASGRDADAVLCSVTDDGLIIHSIGEWVFTIEAASAEAGEHEASIRVAAPDKVTALHDDDARTDDRPKGDGTILLESAGTGQMNLPLIKVQFAAKGLTSGTGASIDVTGTVVCLKM
ncbi:MAG: hypothetical protein OEW06_16230 [Gemmatimonadota bacterium]|nr:hypothetical protein [Gemmatimonadota bacterium]